MKEQRKISLATYVVSLIIMAVIVGVIMFVALRGNTKENKNNLERGNTTSGITENVSNTNTVNNEQQVGTKDNIVLYKGYEIDANKVGEQSIDYAAHEYNEANKTKYNVQYYNYENGKYTGTSTGNFVVTLGDEEGGEGQTQNVGKFAMTKKYEVYPREYTVVYDLPEKLKYLEEQSEEADYKLCVHSIDLDGDGKTEYIAYYRDMNAIGWNSRSEEDTYSDIVIFDSEFNKIAEKYIKSGAVDAKENEKAFITLDAIEYIDIDGDGIMEIIVNTPGYENMGNIYIMKYKNGTLEGNVDLIAPIIAVENEDI